MYFYKKLKFKLNLFYLYYFPAVKRIIDADADMIFLMDSSNLVGPHDFAKQKYFVRYLSKYLKMAPGQSRAAVISYGTNAITVLGFQDYNSVPEFNKILQSATPVGGSRNIINALRYTKSLLKDTRVDKKKIVILLATGPQQGHHGSINYNAALQDIRNAGAQTLVISIGDKQNHKALHPHVRDQRNMIKVETFDSLYPRVYPIAREISNLPGMSVVLFFVF